MDLLLPSFCFCSALVDVCVLLLVWSSASRYLVCSIVSEVDIFGCFPFAFEKTNFHLIKGV